ncbi:MAG: ribosome silencing factor [bacterium]|nr:ribosome silencing factor [bacterium]
MRRQTTPIALTTPASDSTPDSETTSQTIPDPAATKLAMTLATSLDEKQASEITILDVSGPLVIADYFVIATVRSTRQAQSLARELDAASKAMRGRRRRHASGLDGDETNWVLLDFDEVVVHLFLPEARSYYALETLWADVPRVPFESTASSATDEEAAGDEIRQPTLDGFGAFLPGGDSEADHDPGDEPDQN